MEKQIKILQNRPSVATVVTSSSHLKSLDGHQIQIPHDNRQIVQPLPVGSGVTNKRRTIGSNPPLPVAAAPAAMSTPKSVNVHQNFLEEPHIFGKNGPKLVLNGRDNNRGVVNAPVAAEPPLARPTQGEFVPQVHQNAPSPEEVMEAPQHFKNGQKSNSVQVDNHPSKLQPLGQPRKLDNGHGHGFGFNGDDHMEENEVNVGPRRAAYGRYSVSYTHLTLPTKA